MKVKAILVGVIVIMALLAMVALQNEKIKSLKSDNEQLTTYAKREHDTAQLYINKYGYSVAKATALELSLANANELRNSDKLNFVNEFAGVKKSLKNLESTTRSITVVEHEWDLALIDTILSAINNNGFATTADFIDMPNTFSISEIDSINAIPAQKFHYEDSLNRISGVIVGDRIKPSIHVVIPIEGVVYWQRKKVLGIRIGKRNWFSEIKTTNPIATIKQNELTIIRK